MLTFFSFGGWPAVDEIGLSTAGALTLPVCFVCATAPGLMHCSHLLAACAVLAVAACGALPSPCATRRLLPLRASAKVLCPAAAHLCHKRRALSFSPRSARARVHRVSDRERCSCEAVVNPRAQAARRARTRPPTCPACLRPGRQEPRPPPARRRDGRLWMRWAKSTCKSMPRGGSRVTAGADAR